MPQVICYTDIRTKGEIDQRPYRALTEEEALTAALNLLDFYAVLNNKRLARDTRQEPAWIVLSWKTVNNDIKRHS